MEYMRKAEAPDVDGTVLGAATDQTEAIDGTKCNKYRSDLSYGSFDPIWANLLVFEADVGISPVKLI